MSLPLDKNSLRILREAIQTIETHNTAISTAFETAHFLANSSVGEIAKAVHNIQASMSFSNFDIGQLEIIDTDLLKELDSYLQKLWPALEREPDTHEVLEQPETDLLLPETREHIVLYSPSIRILEQLRSSHLSLHDLQWREFEELVAELLRQDGYHVNLGPGTKDGGVDIIAYKEDPIIGFYLTVWQAKKLNKTNKVKVSVIRELAGVRQRNNATKGIIVTTTSLTKDALDWIEQDRYTLGKVDGNDLSNWIQKGKHQ